LRRSYKKVHNEPGKQKDEENWSRCDRVTRWVIDKFFAGGWSLENAEFPGGLDRLASAIRFSENRKFREKLHSLMLTVADRAPGLIDRRYFDPLCNLAAEFYVRPLDEWTPRGKSYKTKFRSLVDHLLVRYPIPEFLYQLIADVYIYWNASRFFTSVAGGARVVRCFNGGILEIPMTKKMCHHFMQSPPGFSFFEAVRSAQVAALGGSRQLARAICTTDLGRGAQLDEGFWLSVIRWFCEQPDVDVNQVGPLVDYIEHERAENPDYSLKGRTARSLTQRMAEWHRQLALEKRLYGIKFNPSDIEEGIWEMPSRHGNARTKVIWTMEEVLTSKLLQEEGKVMKHCVYIYASKISSGLCSIWSLRNDGQRVLTVEVLNESRMIIQARGKCNRAPKRVELNFLNRWARENGLKVEI
jgi:hypothetical protein